MTAERACGAGEAEKTNENEQDGRTCHFCCSAPVYATKAPVSPVKPTKTSSPPSRGSNLLLYPLSSAQFSAQLLQKIWEIVGHQKIGSSAIELATSREDVQNENLE